MLLITLIFSGCSSSGTSLKDLSIVEGMGIDLIDDDVVITVQTLNLSKEGYGAEALSGNITMNTSGSGDCIMNAISQIKESLTKELFFGQNGLLVFGMEMAKERIDKNLDYILRSADSRMDVSICISESKAADILSSPENDALVPSESISGLLKLGEESGFAADVSANELLNLYLDKTSDMFLPVVKAGERSASVSGIAIYSDTQLVKVLDSDSTYGFLFLSDKISEGDLAVTSDNLGKIGMRIITSKSKTRASYEDGRVVLHADIKAEIMLDAVENGLTTTITNDYLNEIEALAEKQITAYCRAVFSDCTENGSDSLRIGESLAMFSPSAYAKLSDDWKSALSTASLDISVKCKLKKINENSKGY